MRSSDFQDCVELRAPCGPAMRQAHAPIRRALRARGAAQAWSRSETRHSWIAPCSRDHSGARACTRRVRHRGSPPRGWRAPRWCSCCVSAGARLGTRRRRIDRAASLTSTSSAARTMASPTRVSSRSSSMFAAAAAFLTSTVRGDEVRRCAKAADGEVFAGAGGLDAVVARRRGTACSPRGSRSVRNCMMVRVQIILPAYASPVFRQRAFAGREDLHRPAARRPRRDESGDVAGAASTPVGTGARDHRREHRPCRRLRRRHLPGHRHADLRGARRRSARTRSR